MELHMDRRPLQQALGREPDSPSCMAPALPQAPHLTWQCWCMATQVACHLDALDLRSDTLWSSISMHAPVRQHRREPAPAKQLHVVSGRLEEALPAAVLCAPAGSTSASSLRLWDMIQPCWTGGCPPRRASWWTWRGWVPLGPRCWGTRRTRGALAARAGPR